MYTFVRGERLRVRWNLEHIVKAEEYDGLLEETHKMIERCREYYDRLSPHMDEADFKELLVFNERLKRNIKRLSDLPDLMKYMDNRSSTAELFGTKSVKVLDDYKKWSRKFILWIQGKESSWDDGLDESSAKKLFQSVGEYQPVLEKIRRKGKYALSEKEERIIDMKNSTGAEILIDKWIDLETSFTYTVKIGKKTKKTRHESELEALMYSGSAKQRQAGYIACFEQYEENINQFFWLFENRARDWNNEAKLRKYSSAIAVRNEENDVSDAFISHILQSVVDFRESTYHRFFSAKAKKMGVKKLHIFDRYAPINSKREKIPFTQALEQVYSALGRFSPDFEQLARDLVEKGHIDSHPRNTKLSGAGTYNITPDILPYILLNHNDTSDARSLLVHELSHAYIYRHSSHLPTDAQDPVVTVDEAAATLGELILFDYLLDKAEDPEERKELIADRLTDSYRTVLKNTYITLFEQQAHELIMKGTNADQLSDLYYSLLKDQHGKSMTLHPSFRYEWATVRNLVETPFYNSGYPFGEFAAIAMYKKWKEEGERAIPAILKVYSSGNTKETVETFKQAGIDVSHPDFLKDSFAVISGWVDEFEKL